MTTPDPIKAAELRGYSRGYAAGKRRRMSSREIQRHRAEAHAFRDRVFLGALPAMVAAQGWKMDGVEVTTMPKRVELTWRFADESLKQRGRRYE